MQYIQNKSNVFCAQNMPGRVKVLLMFLTTFCLFRRVGTLTSSTCNSSFCIMDAHEYTATDDGASTPEREK